MNNTFFILKIQKALSSQLKAMALENQFDRLANCLIILIYCYYEFLLFIIQFSKFKFVFLGFPLHEINSNHEMPDLNNVKQRTDHNFSFGGCPAYIIFARLDWTRYVHPHNMWLYSQIFYILMFLCEFERSLCCLCVLFCPQGAWAFE